MRARRGSLLPTAMTTLADAAPAPPLRPTAASPAADGVHPAYRADIDGLRAVAVVSVLVFHFFPSALPGGFVGVDIFFVISGYLISQIIIGGLEQDGFSVAGFYARRVRRLFPALLLVLAAALAFGWVALLRGEYAQLGEHAVAGAAFLANFVFWSESGYFDKAAIAKPLLHLWSLGVEEQFYIFWPVLLALAWRLRANLLLVAGAIAIASFGANLYATSAAPAAAFYSPWTRFWELMIGAMLACLALHRPAWNLAQRPRLASAASIAGLALLALGIVFAREKGFPGWQALLPTAGAALLIVAGPGAAVNRRVLSRGAFVAIGLISYPLYLWHWPLLSFPRIVHGELGAGMRAVLLVLAVILAVLTYAWVERPVKTARNRGAVAAVLVALMLAVGSFGLLVTAERGFAQRAVVQSNVSLDTVRAGAFPPYAAACPLAPASRKNLFQCYADTREPPRFALLGDSKAGALFSGVFRTSAPGGTWMVLASGDSGPLLPVLSDSPIYAYVNRQAVDAAVRTLEAADSVETVVIAAATRALFGLANDHSIADLPASRNGRVALDALDATVSRLVAAGKRVVLVVDNPTLPHPEDCLGRTTASAFVDRLLAAPPNPACTIALAKHLELSRPYRELLGEVQRRHPGRVALFDTLPFLCDTSRQTCALSRDGEIQYGVTDHVSEAAARRLGKALNLQLAAPARGDTQDSKRGSIE